MRTKKAITNTISSLLLQLIIAITGFILQRIFITTYGSSINGLISSIRQFLSYLKIVEAGVGNASIAALYKPLSLYDKDKVNEILSATNLFYKRSGYIFIGLIAVLAILFPYLVNNEINTTLAFCLVIILGMGSIIEYFFIGKYKVLITADQKSYLTFNIQSILIIISTILSIIFIFLGFSVLVVMSISTAVILLNVLFLKVYIKKYYPYLNIRVKPDTQAIKGKWDALIHQIAGLAVFNTPIIIITIFFGLAEVSVYTVYNMVFNAVTLLISSFSSGMLATFGDLIVRNNKENLQKNFNNFEYIFYAIVTFAYTCSALLIMPFIEIYTSGVNDADYNRPLLATLFIIVGIANAIRIPANILVNSAGHFGETKLRAVIEAIINIVASLVFVQLWGTEGVLVGALCSYAYRTIDLIIYASNRILERPLKYTITSLGRNLILSIIAALPFLFLIKIEAESLLAWFSWAGMVALWTFLIIVLGNLLFAPKTMVRIWKQLKSSFILKNK